jgi:hypothetical protein
MGEYELEDNFMAPNSVQGSGKMDRWGKIHLGLFHTIVAKLFEAGTEDKERIILAMIINIIVSFCDPCSDIYVAKTLYDKELYYSCVAILIIDCLPGWLVLLFNINSKRWADFKVLEKIALIIILTLFAPISTPLLLSWWLWEFNCDSTRKFKFIHYNARMSELFSVVLEAPLQILVLVLLYCKGQMVLPWDADSIIKDAYDNSLNFGAIPGIISLFMSIMTVVKGSISVYEANNMKENFVISVFALCTTLFRTLSFTLLIMYTNVFSVAPFLVVVISTFAIILGFRKQEKTEFSLPNTILMSIFMPIAVSKNPAKSQWKIGKKETMEQTARNEKLKSRSNLTSRISYVTTFILLLANVSLALVLKYVPSYHTDECLIITKDNALMIIVCFLLPIGTASFISVLTLRSGEFKTCHLYGAVFSFLVILLSTTSIITLEKMGKLFLI